ncbi:hypothetical protein BGW39_009418 [Mortierella sp. 14UC]|nr:hypothetical protein BGW39_009418 [Mortierella sp. 14UC]
MAPLTRQPICPIDIPEIVESIVMDLLASDIKSCLCVNRTWFHAFIRLLYENVEVVTRNYSYPVRGKIPVSLDIDYYNSSRHPAWRSRGLQWVSFQKYGHYTRSLAVPHVQDFENHVVDAQCFVNLTYLCIAPVPPPPAQDVTYMWDERVWGSPFRLWSEQNKRYTAEIIVEVWVSLIASNPGLKVVNVGLYNVCNGTERIVAALGGLKGLEKVSLTDVCQPNAIELLLDHCPNVEAVFIESFYPVERKERQVFRPMSGEDVGQGTRIQRLSVCPRSEPLGFVWIPHILRRCPQLESLDLPAFYDGMFPTIAAEILRQCLRLTQLSLSSLTEDDRPSFLQLLQELGKGLISLSFDDCTDLFIRDLTPVDRVLSDPWLPTMLQEIRFTGRPEMAWFKYRYPCPTIFQALDDRCPNLRVFDVDIVSLTVEDFIRLKFACRGSLKFLRMMLYIPWSKKSSAVQQAPPDNDQEFTASGSGSIVSASSLLLLPLLSSIHASKAQEQVLFRLTRLGLVSLEEMHLSQLSNS